MKKIKKEYGITLVALVITIIILLILAGISIQTITQTNLFNKTEQAKGEMDNAQEKENEELSSYTDRINEYLPETLSYKVSNGEVEIGAYIKYNPDTITSENEQYKTLISNLSTYSGNTNTDKNTAEKIKQEEIKWRVLDVKDGQVRLISAKPTDLEIQLEGYNGYNNGVKLIDDTCNTLYNNATLASKVQNLKIEDIQDKMKEKDYTKFNKKYGQALEYSENRYFPSILLKEKNQEVTLGENIIKGTELNQSEQNEYINQVETNDEADELKVKYTYWWKKIEAEDFYNDKYYDLFINDGSKFLKYYWLSSRCVAANSDNASFDGYYVHLGYIYARDLYSSSKSPYFGCFCCRPVITLNSNVQIDTSNPGDGTENNGYNIKL